MKNPQHYGPWALVTGASDGIGEAMARRAAADGLNVVLAARSEDKLDALALNLERDHNVQTRVVAADLSSPEGLGTLIAAMDTVDIGLAVLAAGFATTKPFTASAVRDELDMVALNITAVTQLSHTLARRMTARGRGGIILFGSILGWQGVPR